MSTELPTRAQKVLFQSVNYMQLLPGGHCFLCHEDYPVDHDFQKCLGIHGQPKPCGEQCKASKFYTPTFPTPGKDAV